MALLPSRPAILPMLRTAVGACALFSLLPASAQTPGAPAAATARGTLSSSVMDGSTEKFLEGAEVTVGGVTTTTTREGAFTLRDLPAGSYSLEVSYPGLEPRVMAVEVIAGETVALPPIKLTSDVVLLGEFRVTTAREGMAQAVALQKLSVQYKFVAAADQFGEISEGNVGEYLKFLPGVTIDYNVNDARGVSLRGLSTAFTIVAVDGTPMAGASSVDDTRRFEFEQIAMNNVETTELYKTVTPDIPASATGGYVNFVTKSAFDHGDTQRFSYNLAFGAPSTNLSLSKKDGVWGNKEEFVIRPSLELNLSRKLNEKVGFNLNYRYSDKYDDAPRIIETWNTAGAGALATPRLTAYTVQDEQKLTHRQSFAGKIDFRLSERTKAFIAGQWNFYDLLFTQRGLTFNLGSNPTMNGDSVTSGTAGTRTVQNGQLQRRKHGETYHFNANLSHEFENGGALSVTPYWSRADGNYSDTEEGFISSNQTITYSASANPFTLVTLNGIYDLSSAADVSLSKANVPVPVSYLRDVGNYVFNNTATGGNFQSRPWRAVDEKTGVNGNYTLPLELAVPLKLDVGFAYDDVQRDITRPTYRGVIANTTGDALRNLIDVGYVDDIAFGFGSIQAVDPYLVWEAFGSTPMVLGVNDIRKFEEQNIAGYVRLDAEVMPNLLLTGGFRWEEREIDAAGSAFARSVQQPLATAALSYDEIYPSLSVKYTPNRRMVFRGGISRTVGHPDYADLLPLVVETDLGQNNGTITEPDPALEPFFSTNYDLAFDYYLGNSGVIGIALFRKDVENYIIGRSMTASELADAATRRGYDASEFSSGAINTNSAADSQLQGIEFSYAQNLSFLPKPFGGLSIQANFSYTDIESDDLDTFYSQSRSVSPKTANLIIGYRIGRFSTTITNNWVDEQLYGGFVNTSYFTGTANANGALDTRLLRMKDELLTTDVKLEYSVSRYASVYFLARNIFNNGRDEFFRGYSVENRAVELPMRYGEFGDPYFTVGVRGTF